MAGSMTVHCASVQRLLNEWGLVRCPHSGYPHQGPAYYQPSPPPSHVYGNHSPGPGHSPNPYQYLYPSHPPPPHINPHTPHHHHHHQPSPGRLNGRGGSYANRNGHGHGHPPHIYHQNFHPPQHQTYHPLLHAPNPQHPHAQHLAKYPQPYTPPYSYPSPTSAGPYSPSWQPQQPQSPLPKQLSMPPPRDFSPAFYEPPPAPPPPQIPPPVTIAPEPPATVENVANPSVIIDTPSSPLKLQRQPTATQVEQSVEFSTETPIFIPNEEVAAQPIQETTPIERQVHEAPDTSAHLPAAEIKSQPPTPAAPVETLPTTYIMGTISSDADANVPLSPNTKSHSHKISTPGLVASIAIWSRRPEDPSKAPGIIISPRARPPSDIVKQALDVRTPPPSPKSIFASLPAVEGVEEQVEGKEGIVEERVQSESQEKDTSALGDTVGIESSSRVDSTISSSAVTEITDAPTLPGSPISTNTSVSAVTGKDTVGLVLSTSGTNAPPIIVSNGKASKSEAPAVAISSLAAPALVGTTIPIASTSRTTEAEADTTNQLTSVPALVPAPAPAPAPAPVSAAPKSWASLFASSASGSTSSTHQRGALPTSSVVGISIPAPSTPATPSIAVAPAKKSELLNLLTHGLGSIGGGGGGSAAAAATQRIRTRGLINSGNMCFANAVLQVLVYCLPFHKLFIELGRLLGKEKEKEKEKEGGGVNGSVGSGSGSGVYVSGVLGGSGSGGGKVKSQTPFIDATVEFLKEFVEERERKKRDGFSSGGKGGKGKEREVVGDAEEEDEWPESFLPSYVYEAMKEKKRFESMRGGQQEDAEEFLGFYLDTLEEELLYIQNSLAPPSKTAVKEQHVEEKEEMEPPEEDGWLEVGKKNRTIVTRTIKAVESPITRIFGGKFKSTLKAPGQKDSVLVEDWRSLRLDIQRDSIHTIQDALSHITHPQTIQMTNPSRPGVIIDASQKVLVEALPPVLVLHVKRFCYDTTVGGVVKVMKQIRFDPELEIGADMMAPTGKRLQATKYRLFGALYHHGHSASGGHYTLDVLHPNRYPGAKLKEGWVRIDDELVSDVRPEDVFDAWEKDETRNAYLLFYKRIRV
ncbi:cysteine proteinase [Macrolepiota fuliginosa MF-IS2]|uniref:ubiquitinyl hydrolase 1 n=1 Tax=Macrolepiota fuliginosa MF-IS2 TaxID=1400762 RepID=A0A9P6C3L3_9AGAR|nr:cysteine proteinase [Macrolepiota fuliginosa MF-IS2]